MKKILSELPFIRNFDRTKTDFLLKICELIEVPGRYVLTKQFEPSHFFYFLVRGLISFSISVEDRSHEFSVGSSGKRFTPAGWSGFRSPGRYYTTITCREPSVLLKWNHDNLNRFFEQEPELGNEFLLFVLSGSVDLLKQVRVELARNSSINLDTEIGKTKEPENRNENIKIPGPLALLRQSSFFEIFPDGVLRRLAASTQKKYYVNNDRIFTQGDRADGMDMLAYGKAILYFSPDTGEEEIEQSSALHLIDLPGYLVGWSGGSPYETNDVTAVASRNSVIYHIRTENLRRILNQNPHRALEFAKRLLWLLSVRLRNTRTGLISQKHEREILAIRSLIEQNSIQLSVNSPFHKVPHLLSSPLTLEDAFRTLFNLKDRGDSLEKSMSRLSLDILGRLYKEYSFFQGLKNIYMSVVTAPAELGHQETRTMTAKQFVGVFRNIPYVIRGWENLPEKPGHIFIYNHLFNHPYNTLPNHFQITLDSHFISSMVLYAMYAEAGIRVVRVPRAEEYAHTYYYERLGHINVYTKDSGVEQNIEQKKAEREKFFKTAGGFIENGFNIVISPEGKSFATEESPGEFRPGAFLLASSVKPEPFIVPIAVANFDKRINQHVFSLVIKKPFRISERVENPGTNKDGLEKFLTEYRNEYREYVEEAVGGAKTAGSARISLGNFEQVDKKPPVIDKNLFERDIRILEKRIARKGSSATVFYGSSSFRLWRTLAGDFPDQTILNLGFGGARIAYCIYYFDRLVKPVNLKSLIFYAGDNDIADGYLPSQVLNFFTDFYRRFRESFPKTKITFVSIKPSPARLYFLDRITESNELVMQFLRKEPDTSYLNVHNRMLNKTGEIRKELFLEDGLHMSRKGYIVWKETFLENAEEVFPGTA